MTEEELKRREVIVEETVEIQAQAIKRAVEALPSMQCSRGEHELGFRPCPRCGMDLHPRADERTMQIAYVCCDNGHSFETGPEMWGGRVCAKCRAVYVPR